MSVGNTGHYLDLQVNGYDGVDFNSDELCSDDLSRACQRLRQDGVAGILATIITDELECMCRRLKNICRARAADPIVAEVIWGLHIEGPFLNEQPGYIGAHPAAAARSADVDAMQQLLDAGEGLTRIVTLAPERDPRSRVTHLLADRQITVSAGHCNPSPDQLRASIDAGLSMFTHLGNGCPQLLPRHDNIIQRVLRVSDQLAIGWIADGIHVPFETLANYLAVTGFERTFIVSDAIAAAGRGPGKYTLGRREVMVDENLATWSEDGSHLVGSASTLPRMIDRLRQKLHLTEDQLRRLTETNPRAAIRATI